MKKIVILFVIFGIGLLGCGGEDEDEPVSSVTPNPEELTVDVNLTVWHPFTGLLAEALETTTAAYNAQDERVTVSLEYHVPEAYRSDFEQAVQLGAGPDLLVIDQAWLSAMADVRLIEPLDEDITEYIADTVLDPVHRSLEYEERLWAAPLTADVLVMYATLNSSLDNLDILKNVAQFNSVALYPGAEGALGLFLSSGTGMVDEQGQIQVQRLDLIEYFRRYRDLSLSDGIVFSNDLDALVTGEVDIQMGYISDYPDLVMALGDELYVRTLPRVGQKLWQPLVRVTPLAISRNAPEMTIRGAKRYIEFLLSPQAQLRLAEIAGRPPLLRELDVVLEPPLRTFWVQLQSGQPWSPHPTFNEVILPSLDDYLMQLGAAEQDEVVLADDFLANLP